MKANLEYDLPDEREEFEMAVNSVKYYSKLIKIKEFIRTKIKYGDELSSETVSLFQEIRQMICIED